MAIGKKLPFFRPHFNFVDLFGVSGANRSVQDGEVRFQFLGLALATIAFSHLKCTGGAKGDLQ
eukprot:2001050-Karenia_brevis.AAC.1